MEPLTKTGAVAGSPCTGVPRLSVFKEVGLLEDDSMIRRIRSRPSSRRPPPCVRFRSRAEVIREGRFDSESEWETVDSEEDLKPKHLCRAPPRRRQSAFVEIIDRPHTSKTSDSTALSRFSRLGIMAILLALVVPVFDCLSGLILGPNPLFGVRAAAVITESTRTSSQDALSRRDITDTVVCKRWSQQSTLINGTLWLYGGRVMEHNNQKANTWTNDFLTLDLTKSWEITKPAFTGLQRPSGPPPVANGYLWASRSSFFLYGGEFSDTPIESPVPLATWEYDIPSNKWVEHSNPTTEAGVNAPQHNQPVIRVAEGAGFSVASLGKGWFFGGHEDGYTISGTGTNPEYIPRWYLKSLLEYTLPGYPNNEVFDLRGGKDAGGDGVYRNITNLDGSGDGFPERADGILVYIPGFSDEGILLALAGGTDNSFIQMNVIDVYDISKSKWYKQATVGSYPDPRVNPCAVVAAAPDGSSYNVYMFAGQKLLPYGSQKQFDDMWILSVPSFTWIKVDQDDQSVPMGRSGHTCDIWDSQMVVVGGYVGEHIECDSGVYVFDTSTLQWATSFKALTKGSKSNPFSQQPNQIGSNSSSGLEGSYGYTVPKPVISAVGGGPTGGATVTTPAESATAGPLKTGTPVTYTVTRPNGAVYTETGFASSSDSDDGGGGPNVPAIVVGTLAGVLAIVAAYFAFCAWIYRKQLQLYKKHVAMSQAAEATRGEKERAPFLGVFAPPVAGNSGTQSSYSQDRPPLSSRGSAGGGSGSAAIEAAGAVGATPERNRRSSEVEDDDLLGGQEPSFWGTRGVLLNPRRSLRVINRD